MQIVNWQARLTVLGRFSSLRALIVSKSILNVLLVSVSWLILLLMLLGQQLSQ